ncbi:hypothetical protein GALMADRAFT_219084 [Galerina marginata CBS 339.88]|uniref:Uncharacterized protein n=1 Tax=Galerina marginata (strain CBS 339.88) TaxID=685588 RepID=A0A067TUR0_GALM3|nr:hypothetical protein GALMADRAFT_219084 [Galerina marginata CBS 339.88]
MWAGLITNITVFKATTATETELGVTLHIHNEHRVARPTNLQHHFLLQQRSHCGWCLLARNSTCFSLGFVFVVHGSTFTVAHVEGKDDTPTLLAALPNPSAATNATIFFKQGITYNIFTPIKFPALNNVEIRVEGNLTYPSDIPTVQAIVGASSFPGAWYEGQTSFDKKSAGFLGDP